LVCLFASTAGVWVSVRARARKRMRVRMRNILSK
jgi:hypothetical protein